MSPHRPFLLCACPDLAAGWMIVVLCVVTSSAFAQPPQYNRDVRPILADRCFSCHGPDPTARQSDLRLNHRTEATADRDGHRVIYPGLPDASELIRRVTSGDDAERMPPSQTGPPLTPEEIDVLRRWIQDGANYEQHWAFRPLQRPPTAEPTAEPGGDNWPRNAIDGFVLARLKGEGLRPAPEADPATVLRRLSLDLTGLPPTVHELETFERASAADSQAARMDAVDRLLNSPRYGEHMASTWLDAARYADTNGYFTDNARTMWPWRDWVIQAFNSNMAFDRFTVEQLAGDLLPDATDDQKVATGFNRNHMVNNETGIIEEEFRVEYVADRVDTTATVWMGLTMGCARCHDHKFDPISQRDFYGFFAFFNNVPERGLSGSGGNAAPLLTIPAPRQQAEVDRIRAELIRARKEFTAIEDELQAAQEAWESTMLQRQSPMIVTAAVGYHSLDAKPSETDDAVTASTVKGLIGDAARFDGAACLPIDSAFSPDRELEFSVALWVFPESAGTLISRSDGHMDLRGFDITLRKGKAIVNLVNQWNRNAIQVSTSSSLTMRQWQHLTLTYDGTSAATGIRIFINGEPQQTEILQDNLTATIRNDQPLCLGCRAASTYFSGMLDDLYLFNRKLSGAEVLELFGSRLIRSLTTGTARQRTPVQSALLQNLFLKQPPFERFRRITEHLRVLEKEEAVLVRSLPTTMVMQESTEPRQTFVLVRGVYDQPGERVSAAVPGFLSSAAVLSAGTPASEVQPATRLDLANWLVDPSHPLTARVTVNRLWQQLFGAGLVRTPDDFGVQGELPDHPELLDWLACEFIDSGWDIRHMLRLMVDSATYRQSSNVSSELLQRDPENRLLARGARYRMSAEMIRDNALAVSGLLAERIGGPSVMPYQPPGLWQDVTYDSDLTYQEAEGESLFRRSLYTFWKRQSPPPGLLVFDAPTRETCMVQRSRTNTPLQALVLMNDPTFVEAARCLAEQIMTRQNDRVPEGIRFAFRGATSRYPLPDETRILQTAFEEQVRVFSASPDQALQLVHVGHSDLNESLDVVQLAAWTTVASLILCLDETITRR